MVGLLLVLFGGVEASAINIPIYAGQNTLVGEAISFTDGSKLYIYVIMDPTWSIKDIHFQPVSSVSEFPVNGKGNPKIGRFQYTEIDFNVVDLFGTPALYLEVPRSTFPNPNSATVCAAFHAVVAPAEGTGTSGRTETAWAAGTQFVEGGSWASYFCITGSNHED